MTTLPPYQMSSPDMDSSSENIQPEKTQLLTTATETSYPHTGSRIHENHSLGLPRIADCTLSAGDWCLAFVCIFCFALGLTAVFVSPVAVWLGQVNQLIVLGLLLQVMAVCTQKTAQYFLLVVESLRHSSTLRNFESIIQADAITPNTRWPVRLTIIVYLTLPLGLGAAYKNFTGGWTTLQAKTALGSYGWTGPPGTIGLGAQGTALFFNATTPWWTDPTSLGVRGFNIKIDSATRTAMLDGPVTGYVSQLQSLLKHDEIMTLSTVVNATVTELVVDLANSVGTNDLAYWYNNDTVALVSPREATDDKWNEFLKTARNGPDSHVFEDGSANLQFGMQMGIGSNRFIVNGSFILTSRWSGLMGETFGSAAQGFKSYRQRYGASWKITKSSISLSSAEKISDDILTDKQSVSVIENHLMQIGTYYPRAFLEYDWKYAGNWGAPNYTVSDLNIPQYRYVNSDTTMVAAMLWSRIATFNGLANPFYNLMNPEHHLGLYRYLSESKCHISAPTVKKSYALGVILLFHPLIVCSILVLRLICFNHAPISKGFGITSLLAAADADSLRLLRGAGYSGKLEDEVRIVFVVDNAQNCSRHDEPTSNLAQRGKITVYLEQLKQDNCSAPRQSSKNMTSKGVSYG